MVQQLTVSINEQLNKKLNSSAVKDELPLEVIEEIESELRPFEVEATDDIYKLEQHVVFATGVLEKVMSEAFRNRIENHRSRQSENSYHELQKPNFLVTNMDESSSFIQQDEEEQQKKIEDKKRAERKDKAVVKTVKMINKYPSQKDMAKSPPSMACRKFDQA